MLKDKEPMMYKLFPDQAQNCLPLLPLMNLANQVYALLHCFVVREHIVLNDVCHNKIFLCKIYPNTAWNRELLWLYERLNTKNRANSGKNGIYYCEQV